MMSSANSNVLEPLIQMRTGVCSITIGFRMCTDMGQQQVVVPIRVYVCAHASHHQKFVVYVGGQVGRHHRQ